MELEFLKFQHVAGEKYIGVATIRVIFDDRARTKFILRYKVAMDDKGVYRVNSAALKTGIDAQGKDTYAQAVQPDSSYEQEQIRDFILANWVNTPAPASVFDKQPSPSAFQPQAQTHHAQHPQQSFQQSPQYARQPQYVQPENDSVPF